MDYTELKKITLDRLKQCNIDDNEDLLGEALHLIKALKKLVTEKPLVINAEYPEKDYWHMSLLSNYDNVYNFTANKYNCSVREIKTGSKEYYKRQEAIIRHCNENIQYYWEQVSYQREIND